MVTFLWEDDKWVEWETKIEGNPCLKIAENINSEAFQKHFTPLELGIMMNYFTEYEPFSETNLKKSYPLFVAFAGNSILLPPMVLDILRVFYDGPLSMDRAWLFCKDDGKWDVKTFGKDLVTRRICARIHSNRTKNTKYHIWWDIEMLWNNETYKNDIHSFYNTLKVDTLSKFLCQ